MKITLTAQRRDGRLTVRVDGDTLVVNGDVFDFTRLNDGESIEVGGMFAGPTRRIAGEIEAVILLPYGADTAAPMSDDYVFSLDDGVLAVPGHEGVPHGEEGQAVIDWSKKLSPPPAPTQLELDTKRYQRRAAAKDGLIAYMAADNMSRVRAGVWTVPDLVALSNDPDVAALLNDVNTLSFELAVQRLPTITNLMLTPEIKADWADRLANHFYLVS